MVEIPIGNIFNLYKPTEFKYARCHEKYWSTFTIKKHYLFGYVVGQNYTSTDFDEPFGRNYILGTDLNLIMKVSGEYDLVQY